MRSFWGALLLMLFTQSGAWAQTPALWPSAPILKNSDCILEVLAKKMKITLDANKARPAIKPQDKITLEEYQDAVEKFWGWRPSAIVNVYNPVTNQIFLNTTVEFYLPRGRTIFDSLAHEYVHFLQLNYLGRDPDDSYNEDEAVEVQTWFRETFSSQFKGLDFQCPEK